jgi:hypothetical protein
MNEAADRAREEAGDAYIDPTIEVDDDDLSNFFEAEHEQKEFDSMMLGGGE